MYIRVNATPLAKKELINRLSDNKYEISVREKAEQNMANNRLREIVAKLFGIPTKSVKMISGHRSPHKIFSIPDEK